MSILEVTENRDTILNAVSKSTQQDLADDNLSDTFKDVSIKVAEEVLANLPKKVESKLTYNDEKKLKLLRGKLRRMFHKGELVKYEK